MLSVCREQKPHELPSARGIGRTGQNRKGVDDGGAAANRAADPYRYLRILARAPRSTKMSGCRKLDGR